MSSQFSLFTIERGCGKRRYPTRGYAKSSLKVAKKRGALGGRKAPQTMYFCKECGGYHLSSYPPNRNRLRPVEEVTP
jgi:hypothetical protein